jgi:hypothetical protein
MIVSIIYWRKNHKFLTINQTYVILYNIYNIKKKVNETLVKRMSVETFVCRQP